MISFISLFEIINVVTPDPNICSWIAAFVAHAAAVDLNGIKTLLANNFSTFRAKDNRVSNNAPKILLKNCPDCPILSSSVFDISWLIIFKSCTKPRNLCIS